MKVLDFLEKIEEGVKSRRSSFKKKLAEKKAERFLRRKHALRAHLLKAGVTVSSRNVSRAIFLLLLIVNVCLSIYLVVNFATHYGFNVFYFLAVLVFVWVGISLLFLFVSWMLLYLGLDILIYHRKVQMEDVLPDFLQLTSANIRAGMAMDKALWFAVRPRFGVLAKEMEDMAKRTAAGEELESALREFSSKYDSTMLRRAMYLLIEGLKAGGEVGALLDRIATNIQQIQLMKREMAANVTTYVIFISVAVILGAPFLFALSNTLINMIQEIGGALSVPAATSSSLSFKFSADVIDIRDFRIFAFSSLTITSFSASAIISTIQKGDIRGGIKYIPMFMIATMVLYFIFSAVFSSLFSGFF